MVTVSITMTITMNVTITIVVRIPCSATNSTSTMIVNKCYYAHDVVYGY